VAACFLWVAIFPGCSSKPSEMTVVPVRGQLFFQSQPAAGALVILHPLGELESSAWPLGYPRGTVSEDGSFQITTYRDHDGAPEGKYRVLAVWNRAAGGSQTADPENETEDLFQERYSDPARSTLEASVTAPSTELPRLDLK
jgi:hypothetical protein